LTVGFAGIPSPGVKANTDQAELADAQVIILPGLAGTSRGQRLGHGGGWYDRALANIDQAIPRWLLLNDAEVVDHLPSDPWDQGVNALVTENRWVNCDSN
jgi:5-formyltetrahydrofolate cyclo-ligase